MYKIIRKEMLTPTICRMVVEAPRLAAAAKPGQFLIVRADEKGERIPLTISDFDVEKGTVTITSLTREDFDAMLKEIPADVKYGAGAVGRDRETGVFTLQLDLTSKD